MTREVIHMPIPAYEPAARPGHFRRHSRWLYIAGAIAVMMPSAAWSASDAKSAYRHRIAPHRIDIEFDDASVAELEAAMADGTLSAERLVTMCLARIAAYDKRGPRLNAVLSVNPNALKEARALDAERKTKGPRSPIHGIPIILKDNFDTVEMPTTGGSVLLEGSVPTTDAFLVKRLCDAGAIILAKTNMSEFSSGDAFSSLGGQTRNPHDLARSPSGSSSGTGVGIAAGYAPLGLGTDASGSIRWPAASNGVVALKPTMGLLSRSGLIPLARSFDVPGPVARHVADLAASLSVMAAVDPADDTTRASAGKIGSDYAKFLTPDALKGARIGIARDFMGSDPDVDWVIDAAIDRMRAAGATFVDIHCPTWLLEGSDAFYDAVRRPEFHAQIDEYLKTLGPQYPKSLEEMIGRSERFTSMRGDGAGPNTFRWQLFKREVASGSLQDYRYTSVKEHVLPAIQAVLDGMVQSEHLDAIIYPTLANKIPLVTMADSVPASGGRTSAMPSFAKILSLAGWPELVVPAGFIGDNGLPVGLSFAGPAFSDGRLISLGYSFEQLAHVRGRPVNTPPLKAATVIVAE
jgi:amidase